MNLWNSSVRFENGKALTVYLYRAVWNNALKYLRDRNVEEERLKHWFEEEGEMSEENFYSVVREELFRKLRELIDRLPEERKKIMLMSLEGKSGEEIACDLNITIHTVKQQKYRAYKFLREQLGQYTSLLFIFLTSSMRTPKPIIKQWCDPLMTFHKHCSCYSLLTLR